MLCEKLKSFLEENKVKYITITHSQAFTSQQIAAAAHVKGRDMAKTVLVKLNGKMTMIVLPASHHVDIHLLKEICGGQDVSLAQEGEFRNLFPDCELGAMPPFGNLYGIEVYASENFAKNEEISFNGGNHSELVRMSYTDYASLVKPKMFRLSNA